MLVLIRKRISSFGFTLIELLVVIFIIGLLATISLVAGTEIRKRGKNGAIIANLYQVRAEAALIYSRGNAYNDPADALCDVNDTLNGANSDLDLIEREVMRHNNNQPVDCFASTDTYCVQSPLATAGFYCIDSTGYAGTVSNCSAGNISCQ